MLDYLRRSQPVDEDLNFFSSRPALKGFVDSANGTYKATTLHSRRPQNKTTEDTLINSTFKSPQTIPHALVLVNRELLELTAPPAPSLSNSSDDLHSTPPDFIVLFDVSKGLNGFADTLHGGILATLLDEVLGMTVHLRRELHAKDFKALRQINCYTAQLDTRYRRPVPTPGVVIIKSWFKGTEGRKWRVEGGIYTEDGGAVCCECDGLWIDSKPIAKI